MIVIRPISLRDANDFVIKNHRHHNYSVGCKWALSAYCGNKICGVSICGRPVSRELDDGLTCEVTRLCTDGTKNACSALYGASARVAKAMGYKKIITYILESEPGTSLKASGWSIEKTDCGGGSWNCKSRVRKDNHPICKKKRWGKELNK